MRLTETAMPKTTPKPIPMSVAPTRRTIRACRGARNHHAGEAAEGQIAQAYERAGYRLRDRRWRGGTGEIDLVLERGGEIVFVEVKSSRSHARAACALSSHQITRLLQSAEVYLGTLPEGSLTPMRFDVAVVDGAGRFDVIENALAA